MSDSLRSFGEPIILITGALASIAIVLSSYYSNPSPSAYARQQAPRSGFKAYTRVAAPDGCVWRVWPSKTKGRSHNEIELLPDGSVNCERS